MRVESKKWFVAKVNVSGTDDTDGPHGFVVDATSFTEAEARLLRSIAGSLGGTADVRRLRPAKFSEVVFSGDDADGWFQVVVSFIEDGEGRKAKISRYRMAVQAPSVEDAVARAKAAMAGTMADYRIDKVERAPIDGVIERTAVP